MFVASNGVKIGRGRPPLNARLFGRRVRPLNHRIQSGRDASMLSVDQNSSVNVSGAGGDGSSAHSRGFWRDGATRKVDCSFGVSSMPASGSVPKPTVGNVPTGDILRCACGVVALRPPGEPY